MHGGVPAPAPQNPAAWSVPAGTRPGSGLSSSNGGICPETHFFGPYQLGGVPCCGEWFDGVGVQTSSGPIHSKDRKRRGHRCLAAVPLADFTGASVSITKTGSTFTAPVLLPDIRTLLSGGAAYLHKRGLQSGRSAGAHGQPVCGQPSVCPSWDRIEFLAAFVYDAFTPFGKKVPLDHSLFRH